MSANLLAKMTAHGIQITGEGFGGIVQISESDVAGSLAGLPTEVYEFMRLKFCGDISMLNRVVERVAWRMVGEEFTGRIDLGPKLALRLATVAVTQAADGPICPTCKGTGTYRHKDCRGCKGTGRRRMSTRRCAEISGISREVYGRDWDKLVSRHCAILQEFESEGLRHVRRQFRAGD